MICNLMSIFSDQLISYSRQKSHDSDEEHAIA
jgi:hypothetical protein